ncbi:MAG: hypothetical protein GF331_03715 [Chitinivibrionales bacterium]|nr:hypothetical protein [Chitinivibrionales bacterium]
MRKRIPVTLVLTVALLLLTAAHAGNPILIVNKENAAESLSSTDIKRIYTGRMSKIGDLKAVPINRPLDSDIARAFLEEYVGMTPQEFKEFWVMKQIKGEGTPPMIQKTAENAKSIVSQVPGAIAYIDEDDLDDTVKKMPVK